MCLIKIIKSIKYLLEPPTDCTDTAMYIVELVNVFLNPYTSAELALEYINAFPAGFTTRACPADPSVPKPVPPLAVD